MIWLQELTKLNKLFPIPLTCRRRNFYRVSNIEQKIHLIIWHNWLIKIYCDSIQDLINNALKLWYDAWWLEPKAWIWSLLEFHDQSSPIQKGFLKLNICCNIILRSHLPFSYIRSMKLKFHICLRLLT